MKIPFEGFDGFEANEVEYDWFSEQPENENKFEDVADLRDSAALAVEEMDKRLIELPETGKEGVTFAEGLEGSMNMAFSSVYEKLCGTPPQKQYELISEWTRELGERCEVIRTELGKCTQAEIAARISACFNENGCVLAVLDNGIWQEVKDGEELFLDGGLATVEISEINDGQLTLLNYNRGQRREIRMSVDSFVETCGLLFEVLK